MRLKFIMMSKKWLGFGLMYPVGSTFRTGLASIIVASGSSHTYSPVHVHALYEEFVKEFRNIRSIHNGSATFKNFPSDAESLALYIQVSWMGLSCVEWV